MDALTRSVGYIGELPLERELELRQLTDPRIREISESLEVRDNDKFALIDGLVFKKDDEDYKFVVPEFMVNHIVRIHHDDMAHNGFEKICKGIQTRYWFPNLRKRIADYIENCITYVVTNSALQQTESEVSLLSSAERPMETLHVDHFGPLQETKNHFKYILVIVDACSLFTWLFATKSTGSRETIEKLKFVLAIFGNPAEIVSDRGMAFTSNEFADFVSRLNIKHRKIAVAAPWANGIVERVNQFLKSSLSKISDETTGWKKKLEQVQYTINNTFHSSIKSTPSKILLGYQQRSHEDFRLNTFIQKLVGIDSDLENGEKARDTAHQATDLIKHYNKQYKDARTKKPSIYYEDDLVLIRDTRNTPGVNQKLKANYKRPYTIKKCLGNNRYVVTDIPGYNVTARPLNTVLSADRIKYWIKLVNKEKINDDADKR